MTIAMQSISRRTVFSLVGAAAALSFAVPAVVLTASDVEAQTVGMERRQERRAGRRERRDARRAGRHERRDQRRGTTTTTTTTPTTTTGSGGTAPK